MRHFEPRSEAEHRRANGGSGEPDYCATCGLPFMDHHNGECPALNLTPETHAAIREVSRKAADRIMALRKRRD